MLPLTGVPAPDHERQGSNAVHDVTIESPNGSSNYDAIPADFDRVTGQILSGFPELATDLGGDGAAMLRAVGIDPAALQNAGSVVSYRQCMDLVAQAAVQLNTPDFGMQLAQRQVGMLNTPLRSVLRHSATLREALQQIVTHSYAHSRAVTLWLRTNPEDETVSVGHDILLEGLSDRRQSIEQILLVEYLVCMDACGGFAKARRVEFRHQPISSLAYYRAHFGCEVRFGQPGDAIVYGRAILDYPIATIDASVVQQTMAGIDAAHTNRGTPVQAKARGILTHMLGHGIEQGRAHNPDEWDDIASGFGSRVSSGGELSAGLGLGLGNRKLVGSNESVAKALGLHTRTLHRRLREEGTSFQKIKNEVRRDFLVYYLDQTDFSLSEISERLGFAEQSAMSRFCHQRLGQSPTLRRAWAKSQNLSEIGKPESA